MDTGRPLCGSIRILGGLLLSCNRAYAHHDGTRHRAILEDLTMIVWEGDDSRAISPRYEEATGG